MIPELSLDRAFFSEHPPKEFFGISDATWRELCSWWGDLELRPAFLDAFNAGRDFLFSPNALRNRPPKLIEWRGPIRPPERDPLPADLRIDHVFIVSCKNLSKVLRNPSPSVLFREGRTDGGVRGEDWYQIIAPVEYRSLYSAAISHLSLSDFPILPTELSISEKGTLKNALGGGWPYELKPQAHEFIQAVSNGSAAALNSVVNSLDKRERLYWQFIRLHSSSYYILGKQSSGPIRLRVLTPWDFRSRYSFIGMEISPAKQAQPQVNWSALVRDNESMTELYAEGHIEVRWSHGKFNGAPESKIYLDTPHHDAPGYEKI